MRPAPFGAGGAIREAVRGVAEQGVTEQGVAVPWRCRDVCHVTCFFFLNLFFAFFPFIAFFMTQSALSRSLRRSQNMRALIKQSLFLFCPAQMPVACSFLGQTIPERETILC